MSAISTKWHCSSRLFSRRRLSPAVWHSCSNGLREGSGHQGCPGSYEPIVVRMATRFSEQEQDKSSLPVQTVTDELGVHSVTDLFAKAASLSGRLCHALGSAATDARITLLLPNDSRYIVGQWAAWLSGGCVVPLHKRLPAKLLEYHLQDSGSSVLITADELQDVVSNLSRELLDRIQVISLDADGADHLAEPETPNKPTPAWAKSFFMRRKKQPASMVYTSGTTGPPKGVVSSHVAIDAQTRSVAHDWFLGPEDHILHHLPLHHTHGILNGLLAPLWAGSSVQMLPTFDPEKVWHTLLSEDNPVNVMLAVPTMYAKLIAFAKERFWERREEIRDFLKLKLRLCTCGSAPLSLPVLHDWAALTGHVMLERYGMTEFGMGIGGDAVDPDLRVPGTVGRPFSGLTIRMIEQDGYSLLRYRTLAELTKHSTTINTDRGERVVGELFVKGSQMFSYYHEKPKETEKAFTKDGWFRTGDMAELVQHEHKYLLKMLGRRTMDFIKCGGYKISALEVQNALDAIPGVAESAVFGIPDITWGERVVAVVVPESEGHDETFESYIIAQCKESLPPSSVPSVILQAPELPRNVMGKVDKIALRNEYLQRTRSSHFGPCVAE